MLRLLYPLLVPLLALVAMLAPPRRRPRHAARVRPCARALMPTEPAPEPAPSDGARSDEAEAPPRGPVAGRSAPIPDFPAFAVVAMRHHARWEITHAGGQRTPYQARHRIHGVELAVSSLELLDDLLARYEAPTMARPYLDHPGTVPA